MKISIITVCYNSSRTIERTIKSVIEQQYDDLEYIVIDGGSTDNTCEIIQKYEQKISYWISESDEGIYDAMNKGVIASTGDVIAFLNSDDWYREGVLYSVEKLFRENDADMISGGICFMKGGTASIVNSVQQDYIDDYFFDIGLPHPAVFVRADLFHRYGLFNACYQIAADYDWMLRVCLGGAKIVIVRECFTYFSYGGVSTLKRYDARKEQYQAALQWMEYYGKEYLRERLQQYYEKELNSAKKEMAYSQYVRNNLKRLLGDHKEYYIWGVGTRGKQCMELFVMAGINIAGFIDSYADILEFDGYPVFRPNRLKKNIYVCVTPEKYEREILSQLKKTGIDEKNIVFFSSIETLLDNCIRLSNL